MSDSFIRPGSIPVPAYVPVATDPNSILGDGSYYHPLAVVGSGSSAPSRAFPTTGAIIDITVNARPGGNDETGDGSLENPFATFARAIRNVPQTIAVGFRYIVDITGIGIENLPALYEFPVIQSPRYKGVLDTTYPYFVWAEGVTIRALPQLT